MKNFPNNVMKPQNFVLPASLKFSKDYNRILFSENSCLQAQFWLDFPKYGLYWIECKKTSRIYVGQSQEIRTRWKNHRTMLNKQIHYSRQLQIDFDTFGNKSFVFYRILDFGISPKKSKREQCEQILISCIPEDKRYNKSKKGTNNPFYGKHLSEGARYMISEAKKNKPSNFKNYKHSDEVKQTISMKNKGMSSLKRSKPVIVNNVFYESITDASKATGYARKTIRKRASRQDDLFVYWVKKSIV